jgi:porphobilinogen deaminase
MPAERPIIIATRGSALALAQANFILAECRQKFPRLRFELKIIKTTGDKLQSASMARIDSNLPRGLFTKELEVALLKHRADLAVHSLKDLPTELPAGLKLGAVTKRADVRDVLIYRDETFLRAQENDSSADWTPGRAQRRGFKPKMALKDFPPGAVVATSSTRRKAQLLAHRPDFQAVEIRGNVITRLNKLAENAAIDGLLLAAAGLERLNFRITAGGKLQGDAVPDGLLATVLEAEVMLPCVGQGALGIEIREADERLATICERLNHFNSLQCTTAERAFLSAMGGGCQSPVGAYAEVVGEQLRLRAVSFIGGHVQRAEKKLPLPKAVELGQAIALELKPTHS